MDKQKQPQARNDPILLGSGRYRVVYMLDESTCVKYLMRKREKKYGPLVVNYPMQAYTLFKFDIEDFNAYEFANYKKFFEHVKGDLQDSFTKLYGIENNILHAQIVRNADRTISQPLSEQGIVESNLFWMRMLYLQRFLIKQKIPFYHIIPSNIVVKHNFDGSSIPVFVDYKHIGQNILPFQPWLKLWVFGKQKIRLSFVRMIREHAPEADQNWLIRGLL